jgi:hypothetical protein
MFNIRKFLADYSAAYREPFNQALFVRSEEEIITLLKNVILSICNKDNDLDTRFVIRVTHFRVIDDYRQVKEILYNLESDKNRRNKRIEYNIHDYINLKDSCVILLEVGYHVEVNGTSADSIVYIDIPKVVNKYYFKISGTYYNTLYQIADCSTYNNAQNKKRDRNVSFRQLFQKHNIYEKHVKIDMYNHDIEANSLIPTNEQCINYTTDLFGINVCAIKYFLAKFGMAAAMRYLMLPPVYFKLNEPYIGKDSEYVYFNKDTIWMSTPKFFWDSSPVLQSFIYTVYINLPKKCTNLEDIYDKDYWLMMLGQDFKNKNVEKGICMIDSVGRNYDINMQNELRLPDEDKADLLSIIRWQMYEFDALYAKDNYDMTYKKLKLSSYIAGFYAEKLSRALFTACKSINSLTADKLIKNLNIQHDYLLECLKGKDSNNLTCYKNNVNDDDIFSVLKYTFKGASGIGENKNNAIPVKYRLANASHIGKVDCDTSPAGDPGMTGLIGPYADIHQGNYLGDYKEPCSWREVQTNVMEEYRKLTSYKALFTQMGNDSNAANNISHIEQAVNRLLPYTVGTDVYI